MVETANNTKQDEHIVIGEWEFAVGPERILDAEVATRLESLLDHHVPFFETTFPYFFHTATGFPSPIVRIDMSTPLPSDSQEDLLGKIYEIEHRPSGLGIVTTLHPDTIAQFQGLFTQIETMSQRRAAIKLLPHARGPADTILFAEKTGIPLFGPEEDPNDFNEWVFWARGYEEDGEMAVPYEKRALAPVRDDGNKTYLINMGIAKPLASLDEIDWDRPFCIKPTKGISCQGIEFWTPGSKKTGTSTRARIERQLGNGTPYLIQPFIEPEEVVINGKVHNILYRVHAVFNGAWGGYEIIDGNYIARPNLRVHGASDAINGPLRVERR